MTNVEHRFCAVQLGLALMVLTALTPACPAAETVEPTTKESRPFVFSTKSDLERLRSHLLESPWLDEWNRLQNVVTKFRITGPEGKPYSGNDAGEFLQAALRSNGEQSPLRIARHLALFYAISPTEENLWAAESAIKIILDWARHTVSGSEPYTRNLPYPPRPGSNASGRGLAMSLVAVNVVFALDHLYAVYEVPNRHRDEIAAWLSRIGLQIFKSEDYWREANYFSQPYNNHISHHNLGIAAIARFLGRDDWFSHVYDSAANERDFRDMISGGIYNGKEPSDIAKLDKYPLLGEMYDIYRKEKNFDYAFFHLIALGLFATVAENKGLQAWSFRAPSGESIEDAIRFYAQFLARYQCRDRIDGRYGLQHWKNYENRKLAAHYWEFAEYMLAPYSNDERVRELVARIRVTRCSNTKWTILPIYGFPGFSPGSRK